MIIDTIVQFEAFKNEIIGKDVIVLQVLDDSNLHPCTADLSMLYIFNVQTGHEYSILFNHSEKIIDISKEDVIIALNSANIKFSINKKYLLHSLYIDNVYDLLLLYYLRSHKLFDMIDENDMIIYNFYSRKFSSVRGRNRVIPAVKHIEYCRKIKNSCMSILNIIDTDDINSCYEYYNNSVLNAYYNIEKNGLFIDTFILNAETIDDKVFSEYNLYTSTGRPSNRFGGVNFSALNKKDTTREAFISRFKDDGLLIEFDFGGYHLALINDLIGYDVHNENMHEHLGKQYLSANIITEYNHEIVKSMNFQYLYGGAPKEVYDKIEYFRLIKDFIDSIWERGKYTSKISGREVRSAFIDNVNPHKLFNYVLQLTETESNISKINEINAFLQGYNSKLILYTYDSFLIDFSKSDGAKVLNEIYRILTDNKYIVNVKAGRNYKDMVDITNKFKGVA
jgi:hypothetical protein